MRSAWSLAHVGWMAALVLAAGPAGLPTVAADPWDERGRAAPSGGESADAVARPAPARSITPRSGAESRAAEVPGRPRPAGSWWGSLASLAAVVAMIVLGAKLWKRHGPLARAGLPAEAVEVLGRRAIDPRQSLYLVRLGSRILVHGSTPAGLTTLAEITDRVEVDLLAGFCRPPGEDSGSERPRGFAALFDRQLWASRTPGDQSPGARTESAEDMVPGQERLRREEAHA